MSDLIDVQQCLRDVIVPLVYPNGTAQPSITGNDVRVYAGWPSQNGLDNDIGNNITNITIFPKDIERNTTRYSRETQVLTPAVSTITAAVAGSTVTLGGTIKTPQNVGIVVNGKTYVHPVQPTDTLTAIATALAVAVAVDIAGTTNSGPVITVGAGASTIAARIGASGTVGKEVRRQERVFCITIWASTPAIRDLVASTIDAALAQINFLTLSDGYGGRLIYKNSPEVDKLQKATIYRRDLNYSVEYPTTVISQAAAVLFPQTTIVTSATAQVTVTT